MNDIDEKTYIVLQMACELRQLITERMKDGMPDVGIPADSYPLLPLEGESFEGACQRIFGDYVSTKVMHDRMHPEKKYPERFYKNWKPKEPKNKPLHSIAEMQRKERDICG